MLVGAEIIEPRLDEYQRQKLLAVRPALVKVRRPGLVAEVLDILPEATILARSPGEGYDMGDILDGYGHWMPVLQRYAQNIIAYEFANEINARANVDPDWWAGMVRPWLAQARCPVPLCTPGLVPHVRINEFRAALATLPAAYAGVHIYWQQDGPLAAIDAALAGRPDDRPLLVTEINSGAGSVVYHPTIDERAQELCQALSRLAAMPSVTAACVFALTGWQDWGYSFDAADFRTILAAGTAPQETTMRGIDLSNYTFALTPEKIAQLQQRGVGFCIVRASLETNHGQRTIAEQQFGDLWDAGMPYQAYAWCYWGDEPETLIDETLALLAPYGNRYAGDILWLDAEDPPAGHDVAGWLRRAVAHLEASGSGYRPGIYTAHWWWGPSTGDDAEFAGLPLWDADYDGDPDPATFRPFGGWDHATLDQFQGTSTVGDVGDVDLDEAPDPGIFAPAAYTPPPEPPTPETDGLAHLDAVWGYLQALKASRLSVDRRRELAESAQAELILVKQLTGLGT